MYGEIRNIVFCTMAVISDEQKRRKPDTLDYCAEKIWWQQGVTQCGDPVTS